MRVQTMLRDHLRRLEREYYCADAIVHWVLTIRDREVGWLEPLFYYRFRELLTHTMFRYQLACPIFCLMPDHIHMLWMGLTKSSDQLLAMRNIRKHINESLSRIGLCLQDQAYDHVLRNDERRADNFRGLVEYIARNPERAGLVAPGDFKSYKYTGCLLPGYPEVRIFQPDFWLRFDRILSFLRHEVFF